MGAQGKIYGYGGYESLLQWPIMHDESENASVKADVSRRLKLLQLADGALPIGGLSHSFGLESMVEDGLLTTGDLFSYLQNCLWESLLVEAVYCRVAHRFDSRPQSLAQLSARLSALRCARESREASLSLGKRFLKLAAGLEPTAETLEAPAFGDLHFSIAFGYVCGVLTFSESDTVAAFLHQNVAATLSAAQRLLSLGQMQSSRIAWDLKPAIADTVKRSGTFDIESVSAFSHLPELASMRHPFLATRLFMS